MPLKNKPLTIMILAYAGMWCLAAIAPVDRAQWFLENMLPVVAILTLAITYKSFRFSNWSYGWILLFLCLHNYAAHFTYQHTPVDHWLKATFHTPRSYFDRFVHLMFGLLWTYPFREIGHRVLKLRGFWSYLIPVAVNLCFAALFEIIEGMVAFIGGQTGIEYVGLQGDVFDTQKDMGLALGGALLCVGIMLWQLWRHRKSVSNP